MTRLRLCWPPAFCCRPPLPLLFHRTCKFLNRKLWSGTTELERICTLQKLTDDAFYLQTTNNHTSYNNNNHCWQTTLLRIDRSLLFSKALTYERRALEAADCDTNDIQRIAYLIMKKKFSSGSSLESRLGQILYGALQEYCKASRMTHLINARSKVHLDLESARDHRQLVEVWRFLTSYNGTRLETDIDIKLTGIWPTLGIFFDVRTPDFGSAGMVVLDSLKYFVRTYPTIARCLFRRFTATQRYAFGNIAVQLTEFALLALRTRRLAHVIFKYGAKRDTFYEVICYLLVEFGKRECNFDVNRDVHPDSDSSQRKTKGTVERGFNKTQKQKVVEFCDIIDRRLDERADVVLREAGEAQ